MKRLIMRSALALMLTMIVVTFGSQLSALKEAGSGGGGVSGYYWEDQSYRLSTVSFLGFTLSCYYEYTSRVTTQVCGTWGNYKCAAPGAWRWNPPTPCNGDATSPMGYGPC